MNKTLLLSLALLFPICSGTQVRAQNPIETEDTVRTPKEWYRKGAEHQLAGQYAEAMGCYRNALDGFQKLGQSNNGAYALKHMAEIKDELYDAEGSEETFRRALALARQGGGKNIQMEILKELWSMGTRNGDTRLRLACAASMDSLMETTSDVRTKYNYYTQKGNETKALGQYDMAEQWFFRALEMADSTGTEASPANRHLTCSCLRDLYTAMGRYDEALVYAEKAREECQSYTPRDDASYNMPYMTMANIYKLKSDKENCYKCIEKLFESESLTTEPKELFPLYLTRGMCRFAFKDYGAALDDYRKVDGLLAVKYPQTDGYRTSLLALMGGTEHQLGNHAESERLYRMYAGCIRELYGENSTEYVDARIYLANAEGFAGNIDEGCVDYTGAVRDLKALMKRRIPYMSGTEREGLWSPLSSLFTAMTPYALEAGRTKTEFTRDCYDALVMSKSFLLESERSMYDVVKRRGTADDMSVYMTLTSMKNRVRAWERDYAANADSILEVSGKVNRLERLLADRCEGYSDGTGFMDVDYEKVRQALEENEVLVDFTDYVSASQGRKYASYIINKEWDCPLLKPLFAERQMDALGIVRPDMYYDGDYADEVLRLLWEPLKPDIPEGATVYYVPSQLLFQISPESLPLADGSLLGDRYNFVRLSSARELVKMKSGRNRKETRTAVLYGGLRYGMEENDSVYKELQGSREEITDIGEILKGQKWQVLSYSGTEGTEESFVSLHGKSPQLLHIATHGFYYTPEGAEGVNYLKGYTDAMSLSGIVLSGGNAAWSDKTRPEDTSDGILTANDIAGLDMGDTDLAVLSACKSGQGKATSEGLYGLQRAFKKAGVGTIVMSLWNVEDRLSSEFMVTFYKQLVGKTGIRDKRKAFGEAKRIIRAKHPDPFHWAAFVMLD